MAESTVEKWGRRKKTEPETMVKTDPSSKDLESSAVWVLLIGAYTLFVPS